jgi:hypothetical protein
MRDNLAAAVALAAAGPGRYSLDHLLRRRLPGPLVRLTLAGAGALTAYSVAGVVRTRRQRAALPGGAATPADVATSDQSHQSVQSGQAADRRAIA